MASLHGKVIGITGGASGIGLATAKLVASPGAVVSLADINHRALEEVNREIKKNGGCVLITKFNETKSAEVNSWIEKTMKEFGKLDGAANLAGIVSKDYRRDLVSGGRMDVLRSYSLVKEGSEPTSKADMVTLRRGYHHSKHTKGQNVSWQRNGLVSEMRTSQWVRRLADACHGGDQHLATTTPINMHYPQMKARHRISLVPLLPHILMVSRFSPLSCGHRSTCCPICHQCSI